MFYYIPFLFLVLLSLTASAVAFVWAYRNGQFSEQGRAGYLPLSEVERPDGVRDRKGPYVLLALLTGAGAMLALTLAVALLNRNGG